MNQYELAHFTRLATADARGMTCATLARVQPPAVKRSSELEGASLSAGASSKGGESVHVGTMAPERTDAEKRRPCRYLIALRQEHDALPRLLPPSRPLSLAVVTGNMDKP